MLPYFPPSGSDISMNTTAAKDAAVKRNSSRQPQIKLWLTVWSVSLSVQLGRCDVKWNDEECTDSCEQMCCDAYSRSSLICARVQAHCPGSIPKIDASISKLMQLSRGSRIHNVPSCSGHRCGQCPEVIAEWMFSSHVTGGGAGVAGDEGGPRLGVVADWSNSSIRLRSGWQCRLLGWDNNKHRQAVLLPSLGW